MELKKACRMAAALALMLTARVASAQTSDGSQPAFVGPQQPANIPAVKPAKAKTTNHKHRKRPATRTRTLEPDGVRRLTVPTVPHRGAFTRGETVPDVTLPSRRKAPSLMGDTPAASDRKKGKNVDAEGDTYVEPPLHGQGGPGFADPRGSVLRNDVPGGGGGALADGEAGGDAGGGAGAGSGDDGKGNDSGHAPADILRWERHDPQLTEHVQQMLEAGMSWGQVEHALREDGLGSKGGAGHGKTSGIPSDILKLEARTPDLIEEVQSMRESGLTWTQIRGELAIENGANRAGSPFFRGAGRRDSGGNEGGAVGAAGLGAGVSGGGAGGAFSTHALSGAKPAPIPEDRPIHGKSRGR